MQNPPSESINIAETEIALLTEAVDRKSFVCITPSVTTWFQDHALAEQQAGNCTVEYCHHHLQPNVALAYCAYARREDGFFHIKWFGAHSSFPKQGLGREIFTHALRHCYDDLEKITTYGVVLSAYLDVVSYYEDNFDFVRIESEGMPDDQQLMLQSITALRAMFEDDDTSEKTASPEV